MVLSLRGTLVLAVKMTFFFSTGYIIFKDKYVIYSSVVDMSGDC